MSSIQYSFTEDPFHQAPLWTAMLEIYQEFAALCDRHGLRYYVTDGNCIGAIRHKGFIPWDDDFDVSMPRPDYEKFIRLAQRELPEHLRVVNWENTDEFDLIFGKIQEIRKERVLALEEAVGHPLSNGVFIDVFPIDGFPQSRIAAFGLRFAYQWVMLAKRFRLSKYSEQTKKGKVAWLVGMCASLLCHRLKSHRDFMSFFDRLARKYPFEKSIMSGRAAWNNSVWPVIPRSAWGKQKFSAYNGIRVPIPEDYDTCLRADYGNYMELPPVEKRHPTHVYNQRCPWWLGPTNTNVGHL